MCDAKATYYTRCSSQNALSFTSWFLVWRHLFGSMFGSIFLLLPLLVKLTATFHHTKHHLRKCDVRLVPWRIILVVRWSIKTIQYRDRTLLASSKIAHSSLCPRSAVACAFKLGVFIKVINLLQPSAPFTYLKDGVQLKHWHTPHSQLNWKEHWISAARMAQVSLDTPSGKGVLHLPCIAVCRAIILRYKITGNWLHMSVT